MLLILLFEHRPALVSHEQVVHVVRMLLLLRQNPFEEHPGGRIPVAEVAHHLAVGLDGDALGNQIFLDHVDQSIALDVFSMTARDQTGRIKVRLARNFTWRKAGPMQRFFEERVQGQFFNSSFVDKGELRITVHGSVSAKSNEVLQHRMRKIAEEFDSFVEEDRKLDHKSREGTTLVMAIRSWELALFTDLRRKLHQHSSSGGPQVRK